LIPSLSKKNALANLFSKERLLQVSSATYQLRISALNDLNEYEIYWETQKTPQKQRFFVYNKDIVLVLFKGDILPSEGIQNTFYIKRADGRNVATSVRVGNLVTAVKVGKLSCNSTEIYNNIYRTGTHV
jgi:hypothetical protein